MTVTSNALTLTHSHARSLRKKMEQVRELLEKSKSGLSASDLAEITKHLEAAKPVRHAEPKTAPKPDRAESKTAPKTASKTAPKTAPKPKPGRRADPKPDPTKVKRFTSRDVPPGITKPALRRLMRRAGIKRAQRNVYAIAQRELNELTDEVLKPAILCVQHCRRKTVGVRDIKFALARGGPVTALYGF